MPDVVLKNTKMPHVAGRSIHLPIVGKIEYDKDCQFSTSKENANQLVGLGIGLVVVNSGAGQSKPVSDKSNGKPKDDESKPLHEDKGEDINKKSDDGEVLDQNQEDEEIKTGSSKQELIDIINSIDKMDALKEIALGANLIKEGDELPRSKKDMKELFIDKLN